MKNKILTERQVRNRSIIAGILALLIGCLLYTSDAADD